MRLVEGAAALLVAAVASRPAEAGKQPMLNLHNAARNAGNLTNVFWNSKMQRQASRWAQACNFTHDPASRDPENMAWGEPLLSAESGFGVWEAQKKHMKVGGCKNKKDCTAYTNIMNPKVQQIGCASAVCHETFRLHVCRYTERTPCRRVCRAEKGKKKRRACRVACRAANITEVFPEQSGEGDGGMGGGDGVRGGEGVDDMSYDTEMMDEDDVDDDNES